MTGLYILIDGKAEPTDDINLWGLGMSDNNIKFNKFGDSNVSTVFLGMDHSLRGEDPVLFETQVFGGEHDGYIDRYHTLEDSIIGHDTICEMVDKIRIDRENKLNNILP